MKSGSSLKKTKNNYGYEHQPSSITDEFISFSQDALFPVLDIGAAYGVATLPCLKVGAEVIAVDICQEHLDLLKDATPIELQNRLTTQCAHFPNNLVLNTPISAALLSHVLTFLNQEEMKNAIQFLYKNLIPSGKVFIVNYTPYHKTIKNFIPAFLERKAKGLPYPGFIENKWEYNVDHELSKGVPAQIHLFDNEILAQVFSDAGFIIEKSYLFGGKEAGVHEDFCLDGREWVGFVAKKN